MQSYKANALCNVTKPIQDDEVVLCGKQRDPDLYPGDVYLLIVDVRLATPDESPSIHTAVWTSLPTVPTQVIGQALWHTTSLS